MDTINAIPIECTWTALDLLTKNWGDGTVRKLHAARGALGKIRPACIEIQYYDSRDEHSGSDFYAVAESVVEALSAKGWVSGEKHWGYTDDKELHANDEGKTAFFERLATVTTKGAQEMRAAQWFREIKPIPWALPAYRGHGKDRATWQTEDYP